MRVLNKVVVLLAVVAVCVILAGICSECTTRGETSRPDTSESIEVGPKLHMVVENRIDLTEKRGTTWTEVSQETPVIFVHVWDADMPDAGEVCPLCYAPHSTTYVGTTDDLVEEAHRIWNPYWDGHPTPQANRLANTLLDACEQAQAAWNKLEDAQ